MTEGLRLGVDECHGRAGNELRGGAVNHVVEQRLAVGGDVDRNGSVDAARHHAVVEW